MLAEDLLKPKIEKPEKPTGVRLRHTGGWRNRMYVIENPKRPYGDGGFVCNLCVGTKHVAKVTHLWLEDDGGCLVSLGVLDELKQTGMPDLIVVGVTHKPPPLAVGQRAKRLEIQHDENRTINILPHIPELGASE